jgi:hypothetical protein
MSSIFWKIASISVILLSAYAIYNFLSNERYLTQAILFFGLIISVAVKCLDLLIAEDRRHLVQNLKSKK